MLAESQNYFIITRPLRYIAVRSYKVVHQMHCFMFNAVLGLMHKKKGWEVYNES